MSTEKHHVLQQPVQDIEDGAVCEMHLRTLNIPKGGNRVLSLFSSFFQVFLCGIGPTSGPKGPMKSISGN